MLCELHAYNFSLSDSRSFLPTLSTLAQTNLPILIWAGDADWICNWLGNQAVANSVTYSQSSAFKSASLAPYTVNGSQKGTWKSAGNLSFLRVFGAGHEVPYYQPEVSLQVFGQMMTSGTIKST
jgi:carboxypeptidase C (cathepsin A)